MDDLMTEKELAARLRLSRSTIWKLRRQGLPFIRAGRGIRYLWNDIDVWLKTGDNTE